MNISLLTLLMLSFAGLMGLAVAGIMLQKAQARENRWLGRCTAVVAPHTRSRPGRDLVLGRLTDRNSKATFPRRAAGLFGFNPQRVDHYPLRWWIVLPAALVPARVACGAAAMVGGQLSMLLLPVLWIWLCRSFFGFFNSRRTDTLYRQLPDALAMIVRSVRVGIPVVESIRIVSRELAEPTAHEFALLSDQIAIGAALEDALHAMAERSGLAEYRFFATALALQAQTGGGLTETLETLGDVIRKRVALRARGRALASEAKTSAAMLAALPFLAGGALVLINGDYMSVLMTTSTGNMLLAAAALLLSLGMITMRTIISKSLK